MRLLVAITTLAALAIATTTTSYTTKSSKSKSTKTSSHWTPHSRHTPNPKCYNPRTWGPSTLFPHGVPSPTCFQRTTIVRKPHDHRCQLYNGTRTTTITRRCSSCAYVWTTDRVNVHKPKYRTGTDMTTTYSWPLLVSTFVCKRRRRWWKVKPTKKKSSTEDTHTITATGTGEQTSLGPTYVQSAEWITPMITATVTATVTATPGGTPGGTPTTEETVYTMTAEEE